MFLDLNRSGISFWKNERYKYEQIHDDLNETIEKEIPWNEPIPREKTREIDSFFNHTSMNEKISSYFEEGEGFGCRFYINWLMNSRDVLKKERGSHLITNNDWKPFYDS